MMMDLIALACAGAAGIGVLQSALGVALLHRFRTRSVPLSAGSPPVTILKPLYGDETMLEPALASFCEQDYPTFQIVFGVQSAADPALDTVDRLRARYPFVDINVVVDSTRHGRNGKVANLINMMQAARHDILLIADSDIHTQPDTLRRAVAALDQPGVGLATALYTGLPPTDSLVGQLGAAFINRDFLPGALLARGISRQDCFGAIMALRRATLEQIGGFASLADHVADDALLGERVRGLGLDVALIDTVPATTVAETRFDQLFAHELRWARTTKSVEPAGFALSAVRFSMFWATLMLLDSAVAPWGTGGVWALALFTGTWLVRAGLAGYSDHLLRIAAPLPIWCLPFRDFLSIAVMIASYRSNRVAWRGQEHHVIAFTRSELEPGRG